MVQQFKKKPVVIEAIQFKGVNALEIVEWSEESATPARISDDEKKLEIPTLEGKMEVSVNDWVIKGVKGELYPCKPDIFEATYEPANLSS